MPPHTFYFHLCTYLCTSYHSAENKMVSKIFYHIENDILLNTFTVVCIKIWTIFSLSFVDTICILVTFDTENDFLLNTFTVIYVWNNGLFLFSSVATRFFGNIWYSFTFNGAINLRGKVLFGRVQDKNLFLLLTLQPHIGFGLLHLITPGFSIFNKLDPIMS